MVNHDDFHLHDFSNTAGQCPCGARRVTPNTVMTVPVGPVVPFVLITPVTPLNGGSPVGPGFVVFERARGEFGYDLEMAKASVGKGWGVLLETLFKRIAWDKEHNPRSPFVHVVVTQVKEKFGALRMYWYLNNEDANYERVDGFMAALESLSVRICELCGAPGTLRPRSWVVTLCDACAADPKSIAVKQGLEQRDDA